MKLIFPLLRGPLAVHCFYFTMWQLLILYFMLSLDFVQDTGCTLYDHWLRHYFCICAVRCHLSVQPISGRLFRCALCTRLSVLALIYWNLAYPTLFYRPQNPCKLYLNIIYIYNIASVLSAIARLYVFSL